MNGNDSALFHELYAMTARLLGRLSETWGVSEEETVRRLTEQANAIGSSQRSEPLTEREVFLLRRILEGLTLAEISKELNEDVRLTRTRWYKLMSRVRNRVQPGTRTSGQLEVLETLQRNLSLTAAKAAEWEAAVRDARR